MGAVWESRDDGAHWKKLITLTANGPRQEPDLRGTNIVSAAAAAGSLKRLYAALEGGGIYKSDDGGATWSAANEGLPSKSPERVIAHPTNPDIVFCSLGNERVGSEYQPGGVFKSTDSGAHWTSISNGLRQNRNENENFTARYKAFAIAESNPDVMYAANDAWYMGGLFVTKDGGAHWTECNTKIEKFYPAAVPGTVFSVDPKHPEVAWCLGAEHMILTRDAGATWRDGGNYLPEETHRGWRGRGYSGMCATNLRFNPAVKGEAVAQALDSGRAWVSHDGLQTWERYLEQPDPWGAGNDTAFAGPDVIYCTTSRGGFTGIGRSKDGGKTWEVLAGAAHGLPEFHDQADALGVYALAAAPQKAWACIGGKLYGTEDFGDHWKIIHRGPELKWIAGDPNRPNRFYVSGDKNVYATEDGVKFVPIGGPHSGGRISVDNKGRVLVTASNSPRNGLWRWDGEWVRLLDDPFVEATAADPAAPQRILIGTNQNPFCDFCGSSGVWASVDDGKTWSQQNEGLAMLRGYAIAFNPHDPEQIVFGTQGRGFFTARWPRAFEPHGTRAYESTADDRKFAAIDPTPEPPAPEARPAPVVKNGDMAKGAAIPDDWNQHWTGKGKIKVYRDTTVYRSAPASLCVASDGGEAQGQASQVIDAEAGQRFVVHGFLKTADHVRCNVMVQAMNGWTPFHSEQVKFSQGDQDWTEFSKQVELPPGTQRFGIVLYIEGDGKAWLDDVTLSSPGAESH